MYTRSLEKQIEAWLFKNKVLVLYGARQVGKTTLCQKIIKKYDGLYINCEKQSVKNLLFAGNPENIKSFIGSSQLVVFDEAQKIKNIGEILKLFFDTYPKIQILATGSSSFDLANRASEPLTGRKITFSLYPLSFFELNKQEDRSVLNDKLESFLLYGLYPDIVATASSQEKRVKIDELAGDYLYKDVLEFENLKKSDLLMKLLQVLSFQLGSEVSQHELAKTLQTSSETIQRYINLLEKSFVIYRLKSFSRNLRSELNKKIKVYFFDLGVRNSVIQNFTPLEFRVDIDAIWENFLLNERIKFLQNKNKIVSQYFWRTYNQQEIDYIEEADGKISAYEFKWGSRKKFKKPLSFLESYESDFKIINRDNFYSFLGS